MDDKGFIRYYRHILMPEIGEQGQQRITQAKAVIVGLGGLGCPASQYLASSGVGQLVLIDHDTVQLSNLQRQILFTEDDVGKSKVEVATKRLQSINPEIEITPLNSNVTDSSFSAQIHDADVVLDCTDNLAARHFINQQCFENRRKLVSASAIGGKGQLVSFDFSQLAGPCYQCLFPHDYDESQGCDAQGVFGPLLGVMGSMQASQALQLILSKTEGINRLNLIDGFGLSLQSIGLTADPLCPCCSTHQVSRAHSD